MKHLHPLSRLSSSAVRPVRLRLSLPLLSGVLSLLGALPNARANPCSYGEIFDFITANVTATKATGTMPRGDIDRATPVTVEVTATAGGNLPAGVAAGATSAFTADTHEFFFPGFTATSSPSYGHMLSLTNSVEAPLTFTFSKSMRNLTMNFHGGDNKIFTFTDGSGNPVPFTIRGATGSSAGGFVKGYLSDPLTSGNGANSIYVKQLSTNSIAIGEAAFATIQFTNPVSVIQMTQVYARTTFGGTSNYNTTALNNNLFVNFGQYCDQAGVVDTCLAPHVTDWTTVSTSAPQGASGRVIDETGKVITVNYTGGVFGSTLNRLTGFHNISDSPSSALGGLLMVPVRPTFDMVNISNTNTVGSPAVLTWTFGESVRNPMLVLRGSTSSLSTLKFYKADGTTPLPVLLRRPCKCYSVKVAVRLGVFERVSCRDRFFR